MEVIMSCKVAVTWETEIHTKCECGNLWKWSHLELRVGDARIKLKCAVEKLRFEDETGFELAEQCILPWTLVLAA